MSDDGEIGITIIAFVGNVFSPSYANARRAHGLVDPLDHCAFNVVVYGRERKLWALTEWPRARVARSRDSFELGPNRIGWQGDTLVVRFDERCAPFGERLRGQVRLWPEQVFGTALELDAEGQHRWWPVSPHARIEVEIENPDIVFSGAGYHDSNEGELPLERSFRYWTWSRAPLSTGTAVLYDVDRLDGSQLRHGQLFRSDGAVEPLEAPQPASLPSGIWGVPRESRTDAGGQAHLLRSYEDAPFYLRSLLRTRLNGEDCLAMHEALSLTRFDRTWVQLLLPFRMRRRSPWLW